MFKKGVFLGILFVVCLFPRYVGAVTLEIKTYNATKVVLEIHKTQADGEVATGYYGVLGFDFDGKVVSKTPQNLVVSDGLSTKPSLSGLFRIKRFLPVEVKTPTPVLGWRIFLWDAAGKLIDRQDLGFVKVMEEKTESVRDLPIQKEVKDKDGEVSDFSDVKELEGVANQLKETFDRFYLMYKQTLQKVKVLERQNEDLKAEVETSHNSLSVCTEEKAKLEKDILTVKRDYIDLSVSCKEAEEQLDKLLKGYNLCMDYVKAIREGGIQ